MKLYSHTENCWLIVDERNDYIFNTARTRGEAIRNFVDWCSGKGEKMDEWRRCRKEGFKAVKAKATYEYEII
jgi:hypothetical protein